MSVIEAVTVTLYRVKGEHRPKGWRRKPRRQKRLAYRDAAWAKLRMRCGCVHVDDVGGVNVVCRYHDKAFRVSPVRDATPPWEDPPAFDPPAIWGLPRSDEPGLWDYGRAVAFRLARFYAHLDAKAARSPVPGTDDTTNSSSEER